MVRPVKRVFISFVTGMFLAAAIFLFLLSGGKSAGKDLRVPVAPGSSGASLYTSLAKRGVVKSRTLFKVSLKLNAFFRGTIKPGIYEIKSGYSYYSLGKKFSSGDVALLTVPEGYTQREIARLIGKKTGREGSAYLSLLERGIPDYEGKLFPATYRLYTEDPEKLVKKMLETFNSRTGKLKPERNDIILASIIQSEGARVKEFRRISGVFHNRLNSGMKLESDPTLQYIVGKIRLTREVLKNRSPYNTYMYKGLPPGPICNPGLDAIRAAMDPEKHRFYYFVSKRNGWHYFSLDKWEHFRAVGHYQLGYDNGFVPEPGHSVE
jgi:UPF0755 protein